MCSVVFVTRESVTSVKLTLSKRAPPYSHLMYHPPPFILLQSTPNESIINQFYHAKNPIWVGINN